MERSGKIGIGCFETISVLGKGTYGTVLLVRYIKTRKLYAMKVVRKIKNKKKKEKQRKFILNEKNVLIKMKNSQWIVQVKWTFQTSKKLYFVMEYCPGGELFNLLVKYRKFKEETAKFYVAQIVLAIEELHSRDVIYRDLKPENVIIAADGYIKLTDFGLSKIHGQN